ncbi:entry exclusion protein [Salmonella enterica subsp. enterica serovar 4,[5],12:i:-]|uniref:Conjugative transfer: surface exclusion n=48 Tax=Enterobacteriaceae TaxID=543 RepID=Q93GM0_SALTY|nr:MULTISPECIES: entry exclusion protein [Salmonella]NP_490586.1 conjugative transfer: surface exclusion [Salmonella enterica subsp. enterica serovar Typhimurium str. LT2]AQY78030.1 entry exclusion protein [Salmonella enterica subsp. enterica serovar Typhimurium str. USDA-ARS-USMARC-1810]EAA6846333.1 entry exclusion protein [Salmonella enterica subsp. enterica serovar Stanleyville]EAA7418572.1 entry exclusion protein [Salmonella enterica subsp. enterica serovar Heidelberg]EBF8627253.1 entry ex
MGMKNLAQIVLVTVVQFIACYLAEWGVAETGIILLFVLLWQGLFIWLFIQIRKKNNISDEFKFSKGIWYVIMPVCSLLSPLLSLMIFIGGTLYELRRVSGCISIKEWVKCQLDDQYDEDRGLDFESVEYRQTTYYNPSTGYPMHGGVDSAGNTFGSRWQDNNDR